MKVIQKAAIILQIITHFCQSAFMTRHVFLYTSQEAFYLSLISLLKNCPGKIEIEEEFIHLIKNNCVPGNSVYSTTMQMEIQFKLSQLLPLTPADHVSLKSLPIFLGDKVRGLKLFLLTAQEYHYFSIIRVKKMVTDMQHSTIYMLLSYYYSMFLISVFPRLLSYALGHSTRRQCSNTDVQSLPNRAEHSTCCFSWISYGP